MKKSLLILLTAVCSIMYTNDLKAQHLSTIDFWGGVGYTPKYNYDVGISGGATYMRAMDWGFYWGLSAFMQQYNMLYDMSTNNISQTLRHKSNYVFVAPTLAFRLDKMAHTMGYLNAGVGMKMGFTDTLQSELKTNIPGAIPTISKTAFDDSAKSMTFRVGMGITRYFYLSKSWRLSMTADAGFTIGRLSSITVADNQYNGNLDKFYRPTYYSIRIGLCHRRPTQYDNVRYNVW